MFEAFEGSIRQLRAGKERLGLPQPLFWQPKKQLGLPEPVVWQSQEPERKTWLATALSVAAPRGAVWHVSRGLEGLEGLKRLKAASGSFGPVGKERLGLPQPLVWQPKKTTWLARARSLAVPRAGKKDLACHRPCLAARFEGFGRFGGF